MSAETTKVDVLVVMQEHIDTAEEMVAAQGNLYGAEELLERAKATRAAVAELIETQRETLKMLEAAHRQLGMWTQDNKRIQRARTALARIGGAA